VTFFLPVEPRVVDPLHKIKWLDAAAKEGARSDDPIEDAILRMIRGDEEVPEEVYLAVHFFNDIRHRNALEALLIAGGDVNDLHNLLNLPLLMAAVYTTFMFDVSVFKHYPDRWNYVMENPDHEERDAKGYEFKVAALEKGIEYLRPALRMDRGVVSNEHAMARGLTMAFMRVCDDGRSASARRAEEARKWAEVLVKTLQISAEMNSDKGPSVDDLIIELRKEISHEEIHAEILH